MIHSQQLFEQEVYVWSKLKHPNVLELLGYAFCDDTGYPILISEWMRHGTAWSYVRKNDQLKLSDVWLLVNISCTVLAITPCAKITGLRHRKWPFVPP